MIVSVASSTLYLAQRRDGAAISSPSFEEFGGEGNQSFGVEAVAPGHPRDAVPSATPGHPHGGATPCHIHHEHAAHHPHHGFHPLVARRKPAPADHHHGAAKPSHHATPSADVSDHAFARAPHVSHNAFPKHGHAHGHGMPHGPSPSAMGPFLPAPQTGLDPNMPGPSRPHPSAPRSPRARPHATHHHDQSQPGAIGPYAFAGGMSATMPASTPQAVPERKPSILEI
jgi:hypothetical protein